MAGIAGAAIYRIVRDRNRRRLMEYHDQLRHERSSPYGASSAFDAASALSSTQDNDSGSDGWNLDREVQHEEARSLGRFGQLSRPGGFSFLRPRDNQGRIVPPASGSDPTDD